LVSDRTLLLDTAARVCNPDLYNDPIIVCGEEHRFLVAEQLRQIGVTPAALILEPLGRGTAPAVTIAALKQLEIHSTALLVVLPADHAIANVENFHAAMMTAADAARRGRIVSLGIVPTHPATGYGYIAVGKRLKDVPNCFEIDRFVEKPDLSTATTLIESGRNYWNAGIFVASPDVFLNQFAAQHPETVQLCRNAIANGQQDLDFYRPNAESFEVIEAISIDHGIMEGTAAGAVIPVEMGWSDVGSWTALWELSDKDDSGNAVRGSVHHLKTHGCYLRSEGPLLATIGIDDLIVVADSDAVLVASCDHAQSVKDVFDSLKRSRRREVDSHRKVYRPWGSYESVDAGDRFQVKRITVNPGAKLSLQKHRYRAEHWVVVSGRALVTRGSEKFQLSENESAYIPVGEEHRLENAGTEPLHLIEVQSGSYLGEDDIIRLEDTYGRDKVGPTAARIEQPVKNADAVDAVG
jgi:mannose-1-phosphate guanylyltransferase/mannose-6-phosphate isomerase